MEQSPVYAGSQFQAGQEPAPQVQQGTPELDNLMSRNRTAMLGSIIELDDELVNAHDFSLQQERTARTKDITTAYEAEMQDMAARPYGDPQSFFDKNGNFRQAYYQERKNRYLAMLNGMGTGFLGDEAKAKANAALEETRRAMDTYAQSVVKASVKQHGVKLFERNYFDALANGQYNLAISYITQAAKSKIINSQAAASYHKKAYAANAARQVQAPGGWEKFMNSLPGED